MDPAPVEPSAYSLTDSPLLSEILARRGLTDPAQVAAFLDPRLEDLSDPSLLPALDAAAARVKTALARGERIAIYGDYDVDGLTSTAMLVRALSRMGARVDAYIPNRLTDGYGLNPAVVAEIANSGAGLLITVDCGTSNAQELALARDRGLDTIVVDHHQVGDPDLPAMAFVSPRRPDSGYPFPSLTAAGLTLQLIRALDLPGATGSALPLAALGTVADVGPLVGENRIIVRHGLARFAAYAPPGLQALARDAGIHAADITCWHAGFLLGPRINAAGRMDDPRVALDLLLTDDPDEARRLASTLSSLNARRQREMDRIFAEAEKRMRAGASGAAAAPLLLLHDAGWSIGLVGLVASRLVDRYHRPAIVLSRGDTLSRGSARSIEGFDIARALAQCRDLLHAHGGHSRAAGLTVETDRLVELEERLVGLLQESFADGIPAPSLTLDAELHPNEWTLATESLVATLEPLGSGNPEPVFVTRDVRIRRPRTSRDGKHLMFDVASRGCTARAVYFGGGGCLSELIRADRFDVAYTVRRDRWQGRESLKLHIVDIRPAAG